MPASGFRLTDARFRGRARGVWEVFPACPRADSAFKMLGFGVARGVFWRSFRRVRELVRLQNARSRGRARGVLEVFPACPRADSGFKMLGFGVARGVFWAGLQVEGTAGTAVKGGDPTPTYLPVHSPRSEGSSVCVCVCVCVLGGGGVPTYRAGGPVHAKEYAQHTHAAMESQRISTSSTFGSSQNVLQVQPSSTFGLHLCVILRPS